MTPAPQQRIAVIGSGISGLAAAYFLSRKYEVWLFEKEERIGGHTHTHLIDDPTGPLPIDTGFIVHNEHTYPRLVRLFQELGVKTQWSDMSFGVTCGRSGLEYSSRGLRGFFAQRSNFLRLRHYSFFRELVRFNRQAVRFLDTPELHECTLAEFLEWENFSTDLTERYLYPMASAVWSTSLKEIGDFPALTLIRFFKNHGFLGINTQYRWKSVTGGSSAYVPSITAPYAERIITNARISSVRRERGFVELQFADRTAQRFDHVVFATHGNQILPLLDSTTSDERKVLGSFRTTPSTVWLHTDSSIMPRRRDAWASWNYHVARDGEAAEGVTVTYHMNRLQALQTKRDYFVTLNATDTIDRSKVLREMSYAHPLYTREAIDAQQRWAEVSGKNRTHFCGAYWYYGFHEDGLRSALRVAQALGVEWQAGTRSLEAEVEPEFAAAAGAGR